jgi:uncharacterized protein YjdB
LPEIVSMRAVVLLSSSVLLLSACGGGGDGLLSRPTEVPARAPLSLTLTPGALSLRGGTGRLRFASSAPGVVSVASADGVSAALTAVAPGTATIVATIESDASVTASIVVTVTDVPAARIDVSPSLDSTTLPTPKSLNAVVRDSSGAALTGRTIAWTSSDATVATVAATGVVTPVAPGTVTIRANTPIGVGLTGSASGSATFVVRGGVSVRLGATPPQLAQGSSRQLSATVVGAPASAVRWTTSNPAVAVVSFTGMVTGLAPGRTVIHAATTTTPVARDSVTITVTAVCSERPLLPIGSEDVRTLDAASCAGSDGDGPYLEERVRYTLTDTVLYRFEFQATADAFLNEMLTPEGQVFNRYLLRANTSIPTHVIGTPGSYDLWSRMYNVSTARYSIRLSPRSTPPDACGLVRVAGSISFRMTFVPTCGSVQLLPVAEVPVGGRLTVRVIGADVRASAAISYWGNAGEVRETGVAQAAGQPAVATLVNASGWPTLFYVSVSALETPRGAVTIQVER